MKTVNLAEVLVPYGIEADLDDGDLIVDVLIIARVSGPDGTTSLQLSSTDGTDWITERGLVSAAQHIMDQNQGVEPRS